MRDRETERQEGWPAPLEFKVMAWQGNGVGRNTKTDQCQMEVGECEVKRA